MSGIDIKADSNEVGSIEKGAVRGVMVAGDGSRWEVERERVVLRKFNGEPEDGDLAEVMVLEDGELVDHWRKGDPRDAPG